jgi:hypothetical protein
MTSPRAPPTLVAPAAKLAKCDERGCRYSICCAPGRAPALFAFDLLELNGEDLRRQPIEARKARLTQQPFVAS